VYLLALLKNHAGEKIHQLHVTCIVGCVVAGMLRRYKYRSTSFIRVDAEADPLGHAVTHQGRQPDGATYGVFA
jgi:hypothetical protein